MRSGRAWALATLVGVSLCAVGMLLRLRVNVTPSLPLGIYRAGELADTVSVGELVCFDVSHPSAPADARAYLGPELLLLKRVIAVAGAVIDRDPSTGVLRVDGLPQRCLPVFEKDSAGADLPGLRFPIVVPPGTVWLGSDHARGFDSRYFGPVPLRALSCGHVRPVWTWEGDEQC